MYFTFVEPREQSGDDGETGLPSWNLPRPGDQEGGREGNLLALPLRPQPGEGGRGRDGEPEESGGEFIAGCYSCPSVLINHSVHWPGASLLIAWAKSDAYND